MGKTRDLFKKIRDIKGKFHAKMGSIKDINVMDQTAQKRGQEQLPHVQGVAAARAQEGLRKHYY